MQNQQRQLAAILFTDIVGYTAMMQRDERQAVAVTRHYITVLNQSVEFHHGKLLNDYGDGSVCAFFSITDAMRCAIEVQKNLQDEPKVPLRIGLHTGEIFFEGNKVMGDSVNVTSRIQSLGQANTILFSKEIFDKIKNQPEFKSASLGLFMFKNVEEPMEIFALANNGLIIPDRKNMSGKLTEITKEQAPWKRLITAGIIILMAAAFFSYRYFSGGPDFTGEKSVAVLPFENTGTDNSEDYISDGITQDIINNLSKISSIQRVIGWFSVKSFKKTTKTIRQIADDLGVGTILTGTIQIVGIRVHIIAELLDANTNKRLWGEDYNYSGKDLLSIQSNVAAAIAKALKAGITPREKVTLSKQYTENIEAYKYYRKGRSFWDARTAASYDSAETNYKQAITLDPDYALAYAGLADCYTYNQKGLPQMEAIPIARSYITKALSLDSTLTEARTTSAFIQSHFEYDWAGAKINLQNIIRDNPGYPTAHLYYANVLLFTGNIEGGIAETRKALALDPLSSVLNMVMARNFYYRQNYDSAITQAQKATILNPDFLSNYYWLGLSFVQEKAYPKAIQCFSKLPSRTFDLGNNGLLFRSYAYAKAGDTSQAKSLLVDASHEDLLRASYLLAEVYVALGHRGEALKALEDAYETHALAMINLKVDPALTPIRNEPRFKALLKKMNFE